MLPANAGPDAKDFPHLHNLMQLTGRVYSGGEPHGQVAFAELEKLGVKTIVSVDGSRPQLELAQQYGLQYVHIPIGYDGVSDEAGKSIARLIQDGQGPIYIHCHHGKHRGPAAAAIACIASGAANSEEALEVLRRAGTSESYSGLWRDVENYTPPAADVQLPELVAVAEVGSMATAMVQIDRAKDNLALAKAAHWSAVAERPDIVAAQEALILRETLHETGRHLADDYDQTFADMLAASETIAIDLEMAIRRGQHEAADQHLHEAAQVMQGLSRKVPGLMAGERLGRSLAQAGAGSGDPLCSARVSDPAESSTSWWCRVGRSAHNRDPSRNS